MFPLEYRMFPFEYHALCVSLRSIPMTVEHFLLKHKTGLPEGFWSTFPNLSILTLTRSRNIQTPAPPMDKCPLEDCRNLLGKTQKPNKLAGKLLDMENPLHRKVTLKISVARKVAPEITETRKISDSDFLIRKSLEQNFL